LKALLLDRKIFLNCIFKNPFLAPAATNQDHLKYLEGNPSSLISVIEFHRVWPWGGAGDGVDRNCGHWTMHDRWRAIREVL